MSTHDKVVNLLNTAAIAPKEADKLENLRKVEELIIKKEPLLLDNFLDEMLAFQTDRSADVRKYIIHFMEQVIKVDEDYLTRIVSNMTIMIRDENVSVVKKLVLSLSHIYKLAFKILATCKILTEGIRQMWINITNIQSTIAEFIDSDNEGLRTHAIKFLESLIITLSFSQNTQNDISLTLVPSGHMILKVDKLEEEGTLAFDTLLAYQASMHISSVNLMICMGSLTNIVKHRPRFFGQVVQAFESLHANLPPTLSKSQVSSVRKQLKMQMLVLLQNPLSSQFESIIMTLLTDLGASQNEVLKNLPKKRKAEESNSNLKKSKMEFNMVREDDEDEDTEVTESKSASTASNQRSRNQDMAAGGIKQLSAVDITAEDLITKLMPQNVTDLVLINMVMLPDQMPASFQSTYTPVAAAGTPNQIKHMARLLAAQLTAAGLGKGYLEIQMQQKEKLKRESDQYDENAAEQDKNSKLAIETVVGGATNNFNASNNEPVKEMPQQLVQSTRRGGIFQFKLSGVTNPLGSDVCEDYALDAMRRILNSLGTNSSSINDSKMKIVINLVVQYGGKLNDELLEYLFTDLRNRHEYALMWLYQEYANHVGYNNLRISEHSDMPQYNICAASILNRLLERGDQKEGLFSRLILEAPSITPNIIEILKTYCQMDNRIYLGMTTLKELIIKRPCQKFEFLNILLDFCLHHKTEVRQNAIRVIKKFHERTDLKDNIEKYSMFYLKMLLNSKPPKDLPKFMEKNESEEDDWTEELIRLCLFTYLSLLPLNHSLVHELANVYTEASSDIKRTILRVIEAPVKGMGMESPQLLLLVENCPKGAETLVTRVIHILTDKVIPSPDLVDRVRDLYEKRVSDVRFLIPVLNGLTKKEVVAALPKLIKLNPVVVKEVFNRLLGIHGQSNGSSSLNPTELLIALHNIDSSKVDLKTIINACSLCFVEKSIYTQEVLATVIQQLLDITPLPTLLMRTVIQSLSNYPKLIGFVMSVLHQLIVKQVWKNKRVWEGFIKCCQRTKPQSFPVLLQLPAQQLKDVFQICPDLREPLLVHVQSFTPHLRAHITKTIMNVLEKDHEDGSMAEKAKKDEDQKLAKQEMLYSQKIEDERKKQKNEQNSEMGNPILTTSTRFHHRN